MNASDALAETVGKVNLGDCVELMRSLPPESAQLVFADPPFNLNKKYRVYRDNLPFEQYLSWTREWLAAAVNLLKPDGSLTLYNIPRLLTYSAPILNELCHFRHWIAWNAGGKPLGRTMQPSHYGILFYTKTGQSKFYDVLAPHKQCRQCLAYAKDYGGKECRRHPFGVQIGDVWDDIHRVRHAGKRISGHPCQLPATLIERLILMTTDESDIVVDPFCGGGSAAVAAKQLGRRYIGAEIDAAYQRQAQRKYDRAMPVKIGNAYASIYLGRIVSIRADDAAEAIRWQQQPRSLRTAAAAGQQAFFDFPDPG